MRNPRETASAEQHVPSCITSVSPAAARHHRCWLGSSPWGEASLLLPGMSLGWETGQDRERAGGSCLSVCPPYPRSARQVLTPAWGHAGEG